MARSCSGVSRASKFFGVVRSVQRVLSQDDFLRSLIVALLGQSRNCCFFWRNFLAQLAGLDTVAAAGCGASLALFAEPLPAPHARSAKDASQGRDTTLFRSCARLFLCPEGCDAERAAFFGKYLLAFPTLAVPSDSERSALVSTKRFLSMLEERSAQISLKERRCAGAQGLLRRNLEDLTFSS